jgi:DNA-binding MarR family transcriptional regulator
METLERGPLAVWLNLVQAQTVVAEALEDRLQASHGLSLPEHEVLVRLYSEPNRRLRMHVLADLLLLSRSGATRLVERLVERGLLTRGAATSDRRVIYAVLTDEGARLVEDSFPDFDRAVGEVFAAHLTSNELGSLRRMLRKVLAGNGAWEDQRCNSVVPARVSA